MRKFITNGLVLFSMVAWGFSQEVVRPDTTGPVISPSDTTISRSPPSGLGMIELLDFKNTEIKDVVRGIATKYNLNIFVDDAIRQRITLRLTNISIDEALRFIARENGLELILEGSIYKMIQPEIQIPEPEPEPPMVSCSDDLLTLDLKAEDIHKAVRAIAEASGRNIILKKGADGKITGYLQNVPFEEGLNTLMSSNRFAVRKKDNIYIVEHDLFPETEGGKRVAQRFWVDVEDSLITLDVIEGDLNRIIRETAGRLDVDVFSYGDLKGTVNAQCAGITFEKVLDYLFKGTNYTYRREKDIYFIGDKNISGISSTKLIRMNHIKAEGIIEALPPSITDKATLKVIKEHNALMVVGVQDVISETEGFIRQIDYPIPQILIEALVVDFTTSDALEWGISAMLRSKDDTTSYTSTFFPSLDVTASASTLNKSMQYYGPRWGIKSIGKLPEGFLLNVRALESEGKANIRSQPQIATLNGHPASIKIGTTQYYKLISERPIVGGNQAFNQVTQRFEKVVAEISLEITPWVSASGEITTEIKPTFSTPRGFDPEIPPTIDHRKLESTVRLRDGETIILGGMIQTDDSENIDKLPILGDVPIVGLLFQNKTRQKIKTQLMIYITPHLTYFNELNLPGGTIR